MDGKFSFLFPLPSLLEDNSKQNSKEVPNRSGKLSKDRETAL